MSLQSLIQNWWNKKTPAQKQEFFMRHAQSAAEVIQKKVQDAKQKKEKE